HKVMARLQSRGHTAEHVFDIGMARADDDVILDEARRLGAVVVTSDKELATYVSVTGATSPTVITLRLDNPSASEQIAALEGVLDTLPPGGLDACLITIERGRYRRRPLMP
ncbi:MAG: DUF5615 family PIN-like protein, partial [Chloroflexi bacterium]|nr:DUF5615 family PIN-like protein [Chloroflexota bacterium]